MSETFAIVGAQIGTGPLAGATATVVIRAGRIERLSAEPPPPGLPVLDAAGLILAPGLLELQINGAFGHDFTSNPEAIWAVAAELPRYGVTTFLPTIVTSPPQVTARAQAILQAGPPPAWRGARPLGLHVEGPFLNPERKGAHRPEHLRPPALEAYAAFAPETGVRLVTLAPELPGALDLVRALTERGVVVSAGHSQATLAEARQAFAAGVRCGTHLFNAMPPLGHFEPGLVGAILAEPGWRFGLIADGIHVHPTLVELVWRMGGPGRLILVSDAMAALGQPPGVYALGDHAEVQVDATSARLPGGVLAGSILPQNAAVRNLMRFTGCSLAEALACMTATPADLLGLGDELGRIGPGRRADLALFTPALETVYTFVAGVCVYAQPGRPAVLA